MGTLDLIELLGLTEEEFRQRFRNTPILRAKRVGLQRNACVALGNLGDTAAVPSLGRALVECEPLVRGHAAWALGRLGTSEAQTSLEDAASREQDPEVLAEIQFALQDMREPRAVSSE